MVDIPGIDNATVAQVGRALHVQFDAPQPTRPGVQTASAVYAIDSASADAPLFITTAQPRKTRWARINAATEHDVDVSFDDARFAELDPRVHGDHEALIYRNGKLLDRAKPTAFRGDTDERMWHFTCKDPLWSLQRRWIGRLRENFLPNGSFEDEDDHWVNVGFPSPATDSFPTTNVYDGSKCLRLASNTTGAVRYYQQDFVMHAGGVGLVVFLLAYFFIEDITEPAPFTTGISFQRLDYATLAPKRDLGSSSVAKIDRTSRRRTWDPRVLLVRMPANTTEVLRVKLFCPARGAIRFDACRAVTEESIDMSTPGDFDLAQVASRLTGFVQGRGPYASLAPEKIGDSDLHIQTSMPNTGKTTRRVFQLGDFAKFYDGGDGYGVLDEILRAPDTMDVRMRSTPTSKTLTGYTPRYAPDLRSLQLIYRNYPTEPGRNVKKGIEKVLPAVSIENTANDVTELGAGGSADDLFATREEANYRNTAALDGILLERVESAADGVHLKGLEDLAQQRGKQLEKPVTTHQLVLKEPRHPVTKEVMVQYVGVVLPGCLLSPDVVDGTLVITGDWRVSQAEYDWDQDELTVTINPATVVDDT